jgi:hypothetical protein
MGFELGATHLKTGALPLEPLCQSLFVMVLFSDRVSRTICLGWLQTTIFLISASWVVRITGMSHWMLAPKKFLSTVFCLQRQNWLQTNLELYSVGFALTACRLAVLKKALCIVGVRRWVCAANLRRDAGIWNSKELSRALWGLVGIVNVNKNSWVLQM